MFIQLNECVFKIQLIIVSENIPQMIINNETQYPLSYSRLNVHMQFICIFNFKYKLAAAVG